jgi:hypothetical protein
MGPDGRPTDGVTSRSHHPVRHLLPPGLHFPGAGRLKNWPVPANDESLTRTLLLPYFSFEMIYFLFFKQFLFQTDFPLKI